jgi:hypothetical protein
MFREFIQNQWISSVENWSVSDREPIEGWLSSNSSPFTSMLPELIILSIRLSNINRRISSGSIFLLLFGKEPENRKKMLNY